MLKIPKRIVRRLRWGVSGCGNFTENQFIPALQLLPRSKIISVYSSDNSRARFIADKYSIQNAFSDFDSFLNSDIDCVYIGSANYNHYPQVLKAARAGKHILCEKPVAMNSVQAQEMIEVCKANNVQLSVNYVHRHHPLVVKAKEIIDKGMIGRIVSITAHFNIDFAPNGNFRFNKELSGGGALRDIGTHMIDLLRYFGGDITSIEGITDNIIYKSEVDDFSAAIVKFENSGYGYFNCSFNVKRGINRIEILGYNGSLSIENLIGRKGTTPGKLIIYLQGEAGKAFRKRANKLVYALRSVQKSFLLNQEPKVSGMDGLVNLKLIEALENQQNKTTI